jgi:prepilin-type N-terminal cleavage/methylation domain-containing protein
MIMMNNRKAFTIVELLIVVTIIALLLGILLPSIAMVRAKAKETAQKAQFATIDMALEAFKQDYGDYPPSTLTWTASPSSQYCGAQKLSEALLGLDLMGFNPNSNWQALDGAYDSTIANLQARKGPYLELAKTNVFKLGKLFNNTASLASDTNVLCDVFKVRKTIDKDNTGKLLTAGAPILYYRANTSSKIFDPNITVSDTSYRIYNYVDNDPLVQLGKLTANGSSGLMHPLGYSVSSDNPVFYNDTFKNAALLTGYGGTGTGYGIRNPKITRNVWPYRPDSYILISAGPDGYYGTADDIHNY